MKKILLSLIGVVLFATTYHNGYVDFKQIVKKNIAGNIETIGNTVECVTDLKFAKSLDDINNASCQNDYTKYYNNKYLTKYINVIDNNSSIFNSSSATLKFPSNYKRIVWAGIFWQGHINNYSYQYSFTNDKNNDGYDKYYNNQSEDHKKIYKYIKSNGKYYYHLSNDLPDNTISKITETNANKIVLYIDNHYYNLNATELDYKSDSRTFKNDKTHTYQTKYGVKYSAYAVLPQNIIDKLNSIASSNSEISITVGNIVTTYGLDERLGDYGAWSLVVIYAQTPNISNFRSNIVYYGFKNIYKENNQINIPINGLILPKNGIVNSKLSVFSAEGEYVNSGDANNPESIRINNEFLDENLAGYDKYNVFDGRLSDDIQRNPKLEDNDGIDIDVFDVSKQLTDIRDKEKSINPLIVDYTVNIKASTKNDGVFLSAIAFSTQLYVPKVCYYDLNLYDQNNNLITPNTKIFVGEKIKVKYKIKNDEKESAQNVYVIYPFDNDAIEYIPNSTNVKNVLVNNFVHIDDNQSKGDLGVEVNKSLKVGILGDIFKQFKPYYINNKYVAGIEFNITLKKEGNLSFDFYTNYNYLIGAQNYSYEGILPNCDEFNQTYNIFRPKLGIFNVVHYQPNITDDPVNSSINDLYTQIVNKTFPVTVVKLKDDNHTLENYTGYIKLDLINAPKNENECKTLPSVISPKFVKFFNQSKRNVNIKVNKAYKDLRFRIKYIPTTNGCFNAITSLITNFNPQGIVNTFRTCSDCAITCAKSMAGCNSLENCEEGVNTCLSCIFANAQVKTVCSRDDFAVRPDRFEIVPISSKIKAGESFNLIIKALDYNGVAVNNYNEAIDLNNMLNSASVEITYQDRNVSKGAVTYKLKPQNSLIFNNGVSSLSLTYPDVGDLNISIREKAGNEFAKVDSDDTPNRFIKENNITASFIPYDFNISASYKNFKSSNFTYISNDLNISSVLDVNITAVNKDGNVTKNYSSGLYADDINTTFTHTKIDVSKLLLNKSVDEANSTQFVLTINKNNFTTGKSEEKILLNIKRDYSKPQEPFDFTIDKIKVKDDKNAITSEKALNQSALFKYGRIDIKSVSGYSNELNTTYKYEYWSKNGWVINKEHNSSIFGDVNKTLSFGKNHMIDIELSNITNGEEKVTLSTTHALPYSTKIHLAISSWLWYNPLAKEYKNPSSTNLDCLTHPCESVTFNKVSTGWGGIGASNVKSSETNRTVEINSSSTQIKTNKKEVNKINW